TSGIRHALLTDHGEHVVAGDRLTILIRDFRIPADLAEPLVRAQGFLLAGEADLDAITRLDGLRESQPVDAVVGQHGAVRWVHEQARRRGYQKIAVSDATAEQWVASCSRFVHVGVELVAGQLRKPLDVRDRDLALAGVEGIPDLQRAEGLAKRMHARIELFCSFHPSPRHGRNHARTSLYRSPLHVVQHTANTTQFFAPTGAARSSMD